MHRARLIMFLAVFSAILGVGVRPVSAQNLQAEDILFSAQACARGATPQQIDFLASLILSYQVSPEAVACLDALSLEQGAQLFEAMAVQSGITLEELHAEAIGLQQQNELLTEAENSPTATWNQLIEYTAIPIGLSGFPTGWWADPMCDNDSNDIDYVFTFTFLNAVNDPDRLKSYASPGSPTAPNVTAMLLWYQYNYGGIKGWGDTAGNVVSVCIGNHGYMLSGGAIGILSAMRLVK